MSVEQIIQEVDKLSFANKREVFLHIKTSLTGKEAILKSLEEIKGIGKGIWEMDAQEYINSERADDRS